MMKKLGLCVVACQACLAGAETLYRNDFSTRTSADPIPRADWFVKDYAYPAALFFSYANNGMYLPTLPYSNLERVQDGWAKTMGSNHNAQLVNFRTRTDADPENPFASFSNQSGLYAADQEAMAVQTFHNAFDTGVLRISADLRGPSKWGLSSPYFRVKPLFEEKISPGSTSYAPYAMSFGVEPGSGGNKLQVVGSNGDWSSPVALGRVAADGQPADHWYRFVADLDLDASTYACRVYDLGTDQPGSDTATPAATLGTEQKGKLYRRVADQGPVCGIGLHSKNASAYSLTSATDNALNLSNAPCADNLRVWWKPAGRAADFGADDLVYENDFAMRRYRTVVGASASSSAYASALAVPSRDTYGYWQTCTTGQVFRSKDVTSRNLVGTSKKAVGKDGWTLTLDKPLNAATVVATDEPGGQMLAFAEGGDFVKIAHPIGRTISSGKVLCECDLRTPDKWYNTSRTFTLCLGNDSLAVTENAGYAIRAGISGISNTIETAFHPYAYIDTAAGGSRTLSDILLSPSTWYRVRIVADLASKTYDYDLYELGAKSGSFDRAVPETPVCHRGGLGFFSANNLTAFTTLAIYAYASGSDWKGAEVIDNIRIATGTDGATWTTVYRNDFTTRTRYGARTTSEAALLPAEIDRAGLAGWMRRGVYTGGLVVRDAGNPCVASENEVNIVHAVHTLGRPVTRGKVTVRADIRPPTRSTSYSTQVARVYVGGDEYAQGEVGTYKAERGGTLRSFLEAAAGYFGFARAGDPNTVNYYTKFAPVAFSANGAQTGPVLSDAALTHWYRFVAAFDVGKHVWRVDVYDQGTTQPGIDDANGTPVTAFTDLGFTNTDPTGISAFGLATGASGGTDLLAPDTKGVLFDNLVVERTPPGLMVIFR